MVVLDIERPRRASGPPGAPVPWPAAGAAGPAAPVDRRSGSLTRWEPLSGDALLQRLRITGRPRPRAHPDLVQSLRTGLESELQGDGAGRPALLVTKGRLHRVLACEAHASATRYGEQPFSVAMACGALVNVLFRQLVTVGSLGDPMTDGLAALAVDDRQADLWSWIERLAGPERDELRAEVERQADGLRRRWPGLDPAWLPRTREALRVRLAGGTVDLSARVDLAIGRPARDEASVALVEVKSGSRRVEHRTDLHFYALLEAFRSPAPPFVVATYYTRTGELDVDPVTDELLVGAARRTLTGARLLRRQADGAEPGRGPNPLCAGCSVLPACDLGPWSVDGHDGNVTLHGAER